MKKTERKEKKVARKAIKENIKATLVNTLKQTATALRSDNGKIEKQILKGSNKLAKKIARLIRPAEPSKKTVLQATTPVKEDKTASVEKSAKKSKPVQQETAK